MTKKMAQTEKSHVAIEFDPGQNRGEIAARDGTLAPDEAGKSVILISLHPILLLFTRSCNCWWLRVSV